MAIVRFDPFAELNALHEQMNSLFNENLTGSGNRMLPATDVYRDDKQLTVEAHLPNFEEKDISVNLHEGVLEIKAEHEEKQEESKKGRKYLLKESSSHFYRRIALPKNIDQEAIDASFDKGVLKVSVPYKELPAPKKIAIKGKNK